MAARPDFTFRTLFRVFALAKLGLLTTIIATTPAEAQTFSVIHTSTGGADGGVPHAGSRRRIMPYFRSQVSCAPVLGRAVLTLVLTVLLTGVVAQAQQFSVLTSFVGTDGSGPAGTLTLDSAGNLYGTTFYGGSNNCGYGCGTVFKLTHHSSQWTVATLYEFRGGTDGRHPYGGVTFGPDGALYGSTFEGGSGPCLNDGPTGCGTVFKLMPPATFCRSISCPWTKTTIYYFTGGIDGSGPQGQRGCDFVVGLEATPLVSNGVIFTTGEWSMAYAMDAKTGEILWTFDPHVPRARVRTICCDVVNRGVARNHIVARSVAGLQPRH
jgi:uncharacterized repeat protein (TIGR03803 family)